jgi:hypothetical protein
MLNIKVPEVGVAVAIPRKHTQCNPSVPNKPSDNLKTSTTLKTRTTAKQYLARAQPPPVHGRLTLESSRD